MTHSINTTEARELFAKTTPGEWSRETIEFFIRDGSFRYQREEDAEFIAYAHNNWEEMVKTIERQDKEIERLKERSRKLSEQEIADFATRHDISGGFGELRAMIEDARSL